MRGKATTRVEVGSSVPPVGGPGRFSAPLWWVLVVLAAGCEDVRHDFLPLAPGNRWTYRVRSEGRTLGTESLRVGEELRPSFASPGGVRGLGEGGRGRPLAGTRDRTRRFRVEEPGADGSGRSRAAVWAEDGGTVVRVAGAAATVILQHPPFVGTGWTDEAPDGSVVYVKVVAREAVKTPAGWFFDCVVVRREAENRSSVVTQWFAPDVGLVKWRVERPGTPAVEWLLQEYELVRK